MYFKEFRTFLFSFTTAVSRRQGNRISFSRKWLLRVNITSSACHSSPSPRIISIHTVFTDTSRRDCWKHPEAFRMNVCECVGNRFVLPICFMMLSIMLAVLHPNTCYLHRPSQTLYMCVCTSVSSLETTLPSYTIVQWNSLLSWRGGRRAGVGRTWMDGI